MGRERWGRPGAGGPSNGEAFERWTLMEGRHGAELHLTQKKSAWLNVAFGMVLLGAGAWLRSRPEHSGFGLALMGFAVVWILASIAAVRERRVVRIEDGGITLERREGKTSERWERRRVAGIRIVRKRKKKRADPVPFPWRVVILDGDGNRFRGKFRFQDESVARSFAGELADRLQVSVEDSSRR